VTLLNHDLFTNDILYMEVALDMRPLPADLLPLMPLFCRCSLLMQPEFCLSVSMCGLSARMLHHQEARIASHLLVLLRALACNLRVGADHAC